MSPGKEIPGYAGYIPKKGPGNLFGKSFGATNEIVEKSQEATNGAAPAAPPAPSAPEQKGFPRGRESAGEIPSHIDHVPRKGPVNVSSGSTQGYPKGRPATGEIPSHISHVPRKTRKGQSPPPDSSSGPRLPARSMSPVGCSIPGYGGYVPKVGPRNICGLSYKAANESAANTADAAREAVNESAWSGSSVNSLGRSMSERRVGIPGYAGYIPKKGPANIMGSTYRAGVERAARGSDPVNEAKTETARLQEGASLWEAWSAEPAKPSRSAPNGVSKSTDSKPAGMIIGDIVSAGTPNCSA
jgi:hypothetical protein